VAYSAALDVRITDSCLRDGSHAIRHQFTEQQVRTIVRALDQAHVPVIEVTHGDGLGGSSFNYGFSAVDEKVLIKAAAETARDIKIACLILPGVGTVEDISAARDLGVSIIRIATHATEADISAQHFGIARDLGLETVGFLMMAHSIPPGELAVQAKIMADAGCQCVYVVDSAGALILDEVTDRILAVREAVGPDTQVGFHGHQNLSLAVANTILAIRAGAVQVDGCVRAFGAGAGNTPTEVLAAVCERLGIRTGIDVFTLADAAEDVVRPAMDREPVVDRMSLIMGYAGVYSSFLRHAERAAARYGVSGPELLVRAGERKLVGGQEDMLIGLALELAAERADRAERAGQADLQSADVSAAS
jgi:4-hydroxy 2-oxovalerate aldolase